MPEILPVFSSYEDSPYCNGNCEYSLMQTTCVCIGCKGLNHGRTAYFERLERNKPENLFRGQIVGLLEAIQEWDRDSVDWRAGKVVAGMFFRHDLLKDVATYAEWCQVSVQDVQKFTELLESNGCIEGGRLAMSVDMEKVAANDKDACGEFAVEFVLIVMVAMGEIVRVTEAEAA